MDTKEINMKHVALHNTDRAYRALNKLLKLEAKIMGNEASEKKAPKTDSVFHNTRETSVALEGIEVAINRITSVIGYDAASRAPSPDAKQRRRCRSKHAYKNIHKRDQNGKFAPKR
jgi:hypothetical protein